MHDEPRTGVILPPTFQEVLAITAGLAVLIAMQLLVTDAFFLFYRHLWLDEVHTYLLVTDPDLRHSLMALAGGADYNPPTLYLLMRAFSTFTGQAGEFTMRLFPLLCTLVALVGLYLTLRRAFSPIIAITAILAVWAHPLVVRQAFEARFYAPWIAATIWFSYYLLRVCSARSTILDYLLLCLWSIVTCTIHYFGIISMFLVASPVVIFVHLKLRQRLCVLATVTLGPVALIGCLWFYFGQRLALSVPTWINPPTLSRSYEFWVSLFPSVLIGPIMAFFCVSELTCRYRKELPSTPVPVEALRSFAGIIALLLMPMALILFSYAVQPALVPKYAITTVIGLAPVVAFFMARRSFPLLQLTLVIFFVVLSTAWLQVFVQTERANETRRDRLLAALDRKATVEPVVFEDRHDMYPLVLLAPEHAGGWHFLCVDERQLTGVDNSRLAERDMGRAIARFYPRFQLIEWRSLDRYAAFSLVAKDDDLPRIERDYPGFSKRRVEGQLYELSRKRREIGLEVEENY